MLFTPFVTTINIRNKTNYKTLTRHGTGIVGKCKRETMWLKEIVHIRKMLSLILTLQFFIVLSKINTCHYFASFSCNHYFYQNDIPYHAHSSANHVRLFWTSANHWKNGRSVWRSRKKENDNNDIRRGKSNFFGNKVFSGERFRIKGLNFTRATIWLSQFKPHVEGELFNLRLRYDWIKQNTISNKVDLTLSWWSLNDSHMSTC